ncbi:MAG: polyprenyl synthetase family protein [Mycobacteriales bacterium]
MVPDVPEVLSDAGALVVPRLQQALAALSPENREVLDYHMGWRDSAGQPVQRRGSKSVRPGLALLSAAAVGGSAEDAMPGAVAVECLHNFAFLHDDVADRDRYRRQRQTAWVAFGQGRALNAGTAMLVLGHRTLIEAPSPHREQALRLLVDTCGTMLTGQGLDLAFEHRLDVTVEESMAMTRGKTATLLSCATAIGAVLCTGETEVSRTLHDFGQQVGIAFQARDDLLGIWGRPEQTGGRPPGFDLTAGKGTLPVVVALQAGGPASDELRELLGGRALDEAGVARAAELVAAAGGRAWTEDLARRCVADAEKMLGELAVPAEVRDGLIAVARMGLPDDV